MTSSHTHILPPQAQKKTYFHEAHGEKRSDPYHWLRDPAYPGLVTDPAILHHLKAENAYKDAFFSPLQKDIDLLTQELRGRMKEDDQSVPQYNDGYFYYSRYEAGAQYPLFCRRKGTLDAPEEIILNVPSLAHGKNYFKLGSLEVSPNQRLIAYSADDNGSERFTIHFIDLAAPTKHFEPLPETAGEIEWLDNETVAYTLLTKEWRPDRVFIHRLGTPVSEDTQLYKELDATFRIHIGKSLSQRFLFVTSEGHSSSEIHFMDLHASQRQLKLIRGREPKIEYQVTHWEDAFILAINDTGPNFRLIKVPADDVGTKDWSALPIKEVLPHSETRFLTGVEGFQHALVISGREHGLPVIYLLPPFEKEKAFSATSLETSLKKITFPHEAYEVSTGSHFMYETPTLRLHYSSLGTPDTTYDYHFKTEQLEVKKVKEIPSGFDPSLYHVKRLMAPARDGALVPISLLYHKDALNNGPAPLLLYGYGSYGLSMPAAFNSNRISLVNRGVVFAIAHMRGGSELGRRWYEKGKFLEKKNTFNDYIDCAKYLIDQKFTSAGNLAIMGGSAGGMLVGAVLNQAPELFKAAIAHVPFVDVLNTMLDATLPLTPPEFEEWGNPQDKTYYDYIKSYSPYDNVRAHAYPHLYVTAGLNDPRVTYWEPAKWVALLRETKAAMKDKTVLVFKTEMGQGHGGASGRFDALREIAEDYAFLLWCFQRLPSQE